MSQSKFPSYANTKAAASECWNCAAKMDASTAKDAGYAPGRGQYQLKCGTCGLSKFFDLKAAA